MSAELPQDLRSHFATLEQQAYSLLRTGNYALAENLYRLMLDTVIKRQETENRRIHKGGYLHQIGFSLVLQNKLLDALKSFLLAYVEDTLNVPLTYENNADEAPAARVLRNGFHLTDATFQAIKGLSTKEKETGRVVKKPELILRKYLRQRQISEKELFSLCDPVPTSEDIQRQLIVTLTPQAQKVLNETVSKLGERLLHTAINIAKSKGHKEITEEDIEEAKMKLEGA